MNDNKVTQAADRMNELGMKREPFFFMFDFELDKPVIIQLDNLPRDILIKTPSFEKTNSSNIKTKNIDLKAYPVSFEVYKKSYDNVLKNIMHGNSYLTNLTFPTRIETSASLEEIFYASKAKYKLLYNNKFVVFSPEIFVRINNKGKISSYPMKGTIDADEDNAEEKILNDRKEKAEHDTIVDLIRNDISINAQNVKVNRYRYIDRIKTSKGDILQVSSEISGSLGNDWPARLGSIITSMLPAGSISGAPKKETIRIIKESEMAERGYYTGIFGIFNGESLDSAVMIRFIEQNRRGYVYKSGGGITSMSNAESEYKELIKKIYVPAG